MVCVREYIFLCFFFFNPVFIYLFACLFSKEREKKKEWCWMGGEDLGGGFYLNKTKPNCPPTKPPGQHYDVGQKPVSCTASDPHRTWCWMKCVLRFQPQWMDLTIRQSLTGTKEENARAVLICLFSIHSLSCQSTRLPACLFINSHLSIPTYSHRYSCICLSSYL